MTERLRHESPTCRRLLAYAWLAGALWLGFCLAVPRCSGEAKPHDQAGRTE